MNTRGHPHYSNDPERPMLCGDNVSKGEARGVITAVSTGDRTRVRVNWGGGFTDEQPRALFYEAEPPKVEWITSLPLRVHNRLVDGYHTDADEVALLDAYRRGAIAAEIVDDEPVPTELPGVDRPGMLPGQRPDGSPLVQGDYCRVLVDTAHDPGGRYTWYATDGGDVAAGWAHDPDPLLAVAGQNGARP